MKKFALVIICSLILVVMIAFNYLLWDRENKKKDIESLEYSKVSNNASIRALGEKINTLENGNKDLNDMAKDLEQKLNALKEEKKQLEENSRNVMEILDQKIEIINQLKQKVDTSFLQEPIKNWVDAINKRDYESAYMLQIASMGDGDEKTTLHEFAKAYQNSIKSIQIKFIELVTGNDDNEKTGDIVFGVELEVSKIEGANSNEIYLDEGLNKIYITVGYDKQQDGWVISGISTSSNSSN